MNHFVNNNPLNGDYSENFKRVLFGAGCFWGVERKFWQLDGIWVTSVGYAGGNTKNPTYEDVCYKETGHVEVVEIVYDPEIISFTSLLKVFWECHNPTQGMKQGNDVGTQYRSAIYCYSDLDILECIKSKEIYQIIDTQIKIDTSYSYRVKNVFIIYGTKYKLLAHQIGAITGIAEFTIVSSPSYKMLEMELLRQTVIVKPTPQLSPSPMFFNKSNSKNEIGIYLDLRSGTEYLKPIQVNSTDLTDLENDKKYEYSTQQGVFEVFRIDKKPTSYDDFADQKLMDVQNSMNSTSVSFKDYILPNVKYYYIFRSLNTSLDPSNPTQVYQVELLKDSDDSKISVSTYDFSKEKNYLNRTFKRLIQIKPSFQQSVFDDTKNNVESMSTFKNNLDKLSLGYANHGIWGRKFKIRVKSTDSGKIIDFNIKFKLSIKKTKEDLE